MPAHTHRLRIPISLAVTAACAAGLIPATADAAILKGLQDQEMTVNEPQLLPAFLSAADDARVGLVRFNVRWNGRATAPDAAQIDQIRAFVEQAAAAGSGIKAITVAPNVSGDESFNPRGKKQGPTAASKLSSTAYTSYIGALAAALRDLPVTKYYSALNEPNWYRHLPKRGGAAHYRKLHNIAYTQIKRADPQAKVVLGELLPYARPLSKNYPHGQSTNAGSFLRDVLGLDKNWKGTGSAKSFTVKADGVSLHTYDFKGDPRKKRKNRDEWTQANLSYAKADLKKAAKTKRISSAAAGKVYLTEFAYKTAGADKIPDARAATYLKQAWTIAKQQKVQSFVWYQLRDPQSKGENWQSGLQSRSGAVRPTWKAFVGLR